MVLRGTLLLPPAADQAGEEVDDLSGVAVVSWEVRLQYISYIMLSGFVVIPCAVRRFTGVVG